MLLPDLLDNILYPDDRIQTTTAPSGNNSPTTGTTTGTTRGGYSSGTGQPTPTIDIRGNSNIIFDEIKNVKDVLGYSTDYDYSFNRASLNIPRGGNVPEDFKNLIQLPIAGRFPIYAILTDKVTSRALQAFVENYHVGWYSRNIPSNKKDKENAIVTRLADINKHLLGLQNFIGTTQSNYATAQVKDTQELIQSAIVTIMSIIPQTKILGFTAKAYTANETAKDQAEYIRLITSIQNDARLLQSEVNALKNLFNQLNPTGDLSGLNITGESPVDSLRSANIFSNLSNVEILLLISLIVILIIIFYKKYRK